MQAEFWDNLGTCAEQARGAFAANTERAWHSDVVRFTVWCLQDAHQTLPIDPRRSVACVDALAASEAPASMRRFVASIA
jgi:hypothetical protein